MTPDTRPANRGRHILLAAAAAALVGLLAIALLINAQRSADPDPAAVVPPSSGQSSPSAAPSSPESQPLASEAPAEPLPSPAGTSSQPPPTASAPSNGPSPSGAPVPSTSPSTPVDEAPSDELRMRLVEEITGRINPKSVEASQTGLIFAQNNIYRHTISVYDRDFELVKTLKDSIVLAAWGYPEYPERVQGGPVEAAFSPDGRYAYVTNRSMYGPGFPRPGPLIDQCSPASDIDRSFVVEYDVESLEKTRVFQVGSLPKDLIVTPDGTMLLVSNWCSYDLSVVDLASGEETRRIDTGPYPRGIAVDPTSTFAYVAHLGSNDIARVSLENGRVRDVRNVGPSPRDVLMSPDGRFLYVSLDQGGGVAKVDIKERLVVKRVATGREPRSMTMAPDGLSVYVVHWGGGTASKIRTRDMKVLQTVQTGYHPIGITYDNATRQVWVSTYPGTIRIFQEE
ncbi:hypothetical protein BH20CHL5_BH20CHL5_07310 [soil metagenome]